MRQNIKNNSVMQNICQRLILLKLQCSLNQVFPCQVSNSRTQHAITLSLHAIGLPNMRSTLHKADVDLSLRATSCRRSCASSAVKADVPAWAAQGMKKERRSKKPRNPPPTESQPAKRPESQHLSSSSLRVDHLLEFERNGHVTIPGFVDQADIQSLQQITKRIISAGELEALRHRYGVPS